MFLLIDNYDSFTYNLVQAFYKLGKNPVVKKNDDPELLDLATSPDLEMVCISPGPGRPEEAGYSLEFLDRLNPRIPVLGVCLGHQLLGLYGKGKIVIAPSISHGKQSEIAHDGSGIFKNTPNPFMAGRYHSLVVTPTPESEANFLITSRGPEGEVMSLAYRYRPWVGVQFHPESILTPDGMRLLANFPDNIISQKDRKTNFGQILDQLAARCDLTADMASSAFEALMDGELSPAQAGAFLMGLRMKGESSLELAHAIRAALARSVRVKGTPGQTLDIVGTGGDGRNSFNCSTAASLIMAGLGYKVIKHGNRAVSSTCGAADALEGLGINLNSSSDEILEMLEKKGFAFLFAPHFHPSFKNIGPVRKELGIRTLFNILGPMINPARPTHLLMGVARPELVQLIAETLVQSPIKNAAVLSGAGGYDEMTALGPANIAFIREGKITWEVFDPALYGIMPCQPEELAVGSKEEAIAVLKTILAGKGPKPMMEMVALNIAVAFRLLDPSISQQKAIRKGLDAVYSGIGEKPLENA